MSRDYKATTDRFMEQCARKNREAAEAIHQKRVEMFGTESVKEKGLSIPVLLGLLTAFGLAMFCAYQFFGGE